MDKQITNAFGRTIRVVFSRDMRTGFVQIKNQDNQEIAACALDVDQMRQLSAILTEMTDGR